MTNNSRIRRTIDRIRSEPGLGRNVVVLGVLILVATGVGSYILGKQRLNWPWDHKFAFYAVFAVFPFVFHRQLGKKHAPWAVASGVSSPRRATRHGPAASTPQCPPSWR